MYQGTGDEHSHFGQVQDCITRNTGLMSESISPLKGCIAKARWSSDFDDRQQAARRFHGVGEWKACGTSVPDSNEFHGGTFSDGAHCNFLEQRNLA